MKLSVITVNFNDRCGLQKTIMSVIRQSYADYEYIIIDGGSTDGSVDLIRSYSSNISYWVSEKDRGIYNAMNKAIDVAKGEYCIFLNSGDTFASHETLDMIFSDNPLADIICGSTQTVKWLAEAPDEVTLEYLFSHTICHQCAFIKTTLMSKYKYDEKYRIVSDRKFFLQAFILENCSYLKVPVTVVNYDIEGFSAVNPVLSNMEYESVLQELFPIRILSDYGRKAKGELYGQKYYDKLFIEIRRRHYKDIVYTSVVLVMRIIAIFKKSASFIKHFPIRDK